MRGWWAAFLLLTPGAAQAQTLGDALAAAYRNNPTLNAARLSARGADETIIQARSAYLPRLDLEASAGARESENEPPGGSARLDPRSVGLEAVQPLITGGRRGAQTDLARAQARGARQTLRAVEQAVMLAVVAAYEDVRRDEESVRIRQNDIEVLTRQLQAARDRFEVGEITRTDVAQAEARLAGGEAGLAGARAALEASRANFTRIVGVAPDDLTAPGAPPAAPSSLEAAVAAAIDANPDLRAAEESERAARAQIGVERAGLLPQVSIAAGWSRGEDLQGLGIETEGANITAQLSVPLFEGGFARSRIRQSRYVALAARAQTDEARRFVTAQVTAAWNDVLATERVVESARRQAQANRFALEGVEMEQQVGLRTTLDVLNAQQEYLDSQLAVAQAERDRFVAAHALLSTIGTLDARTLAVNAPLYDPDQSPGAMRGMLPWRDGGESP